MKLTILEENEPIAILERRPSMTGWRYWLVTSSGGAWASIDVVRAYVAGAIVRPTKPDDARAIVNILAEEKAAVQRLSLFDWMLTMGQQQEEDDSLPGGPGAWSERALDF